MYNIKLMWTRFSAPVLTGPGPPSLLYDRYRVSFAGSKEAGAWFDHSHPYGGEVKERVKLYLYLLSGTSWPVLD